MDTEDYSGKDAHKRKDHRKNRDYERKQLKKALTFRRQRDAQEVVEEEDNEEEVVRTVLGAGEILRRIEIDLEDDYGRKNPRALSINNHSADHDQLQRKWRPEDDLEEQDYTDSEDDDEGEGHVKFDIPKNASNVQTFLEDENVKKVFSEKEIMYMSAKEKHAARKARKEAREAIASTQAQNDDNENAASESQPEPQGLKTPALAPREQETIVQKIFRMLLKTVRNDDLYTAQMSKVIGNLSNFGMTDSDFMLPPNKRSAPVPVRSAFYFYQTDRRNQAASKDNSKLTKLNKRALEKAWKDTDSNEKEFYLRRAELDRVRHKMQMEQYKLITAKQDAVKAERVERIEKTKERRDKTRRSKHEDDSDGDTDVDQSKAMYVRNNSKSRSRPSSRPPSRSSSKPRTSSKSKVPASKSKQTDDENEDDDEVQSEKDTSKKKSPAAAHAVWGSDYEDEDISEDELDEAARNAAINQTVDVDFLAPESQKFNFIGLSKEEEERMQLADMMELLGI